MGWVVFGFDKVLERHLGHCALLGGGFFSFDYAKGPNDDVRLALDMPPFLWRSMLQRKA